MKWSPSIQGFYSESSSNVPDDVVSINDDYYRELMNGQLNGKIIVNSADRLPVLIDYPAMTLEQEVAAAEGKKKSLIASANEFIDSKQWPAKLMLGRLSDEDKKAFNKWLDYIDAVSLIETDSAPDILWPEPPKD